MKSFFKKYSQSVAIGLIGLVISGGIVAAAPSPVFTNITQGFIRLATEGLGYFRYGYGYGYFGYLMGYGYGYGYDIRDRMMHIMSGGPAALDPSLFGFGGKSGAASIISFSSGYGPYSPSKPEGYGYTITYKTNYLAKTVIFLYTSTGYNEDKKIYLYDGIPGTDNAESEYASGIRTYSTSGLQCGTHYYVTIGVIDAGGNRWKSEGQEFATADCENGGGSDTSTPATSTPATSTPETPGDTAQQYVPTTGAYPRGSSAPFYPVVRENLPTPPINPNVPKPTALPISPVLRQGASGPGAKILQKTLNYLGFTVAPSGAGSPGNETEFFGPKTEAALGKFQKAYGLKVDGIYGPITKTILQVLIR